MSNADMGGMIFNPDGTTEYVRPERFLWFVAYDEEQNKVKFEKMCEFKAKGNGEDYKLYKSSVPFFYKGCVCAYCVAENMATAENRVMSMILKSVEE